MDEPLAKKIKSEGGGSVSADGPPKDPKGVELLLLGECKRHQQWISPQDQPDMEPPKDYDEHSLHTNKAFQGVDMAMLGQAVQRLLEKSRLVLVNHPKGGRCLRFVSEEQAQQQVERFGGLSTNELLVYQKIEEAKTKGLFQRDLKSRTGITNPNTIRTIIEKLMKRKLIKDFTSVHTGKKKMYILAELEPSAELTGGNWYTAGELDMDLVETSSKLALHFFKSRARRGGSVQEVRDFIKGKGVITCELSIEEMLQLVETLVYDSKVEPVNKDACGIPPEERTFRALNQPTRSLEHFTCLPSAVCPMATAGNPVEPENCPYLDYWRSL